MNRHDELIKRLKQARANTGIPISFESANRDEAAITEAIAVIKSLSIEHDDALDEAIAAVRATGNYERQINAIRALKTASASQPPQTCEHGSIITADGGARCSECMKAAQPAMSTSWIAWFHHYTGGKPFDWSMQGDTELRLCFVAMLSELDRLGGR